MKKLILAVLLALVTTTTAIADEYILIFNHYRETNEWKTSLAITNFSALPNNIKIAVYQPKGGLFDIREVLFAGYPAMEQQVDTLYNLISRPNLPEHGALILKGEYAFAATLFMENIETGGFAAIEKIATFVAD